jgi:hypothetical protein
MQTQIKKPKKKEKKRALKSFLGLFFVFFFGVAGVQAVDRGSVRAIVAVGSGDRAGARRLH